MDAADSNNDPAGSAAESNSFRGILRHHAIGARDADLLRRLTIAIVVGTLFMAAFHQLNLVYSHKFFDVTGRAKWIWAPADVAPGVATVKRQQRAAAERQAHGPLVLASRAAASIRSSVEGIGDVVPIRNGRFDSVLAKQTVRDLFIHDEGSMGRRIDPLAFYATRNFALPASRYYTHIKVAADPEYTLYFNGREVGGRQMGEESRLDVYDVSALARTGPNRIVVAVRSTNSVGGLIVAVDLAPEVANFVVTDSSWRIVAALTPDLLLRDPATYEKPVLLGEPPAGRWNYLEPQDRPVAPPPGSVVSPRSSFSFITALPEIRDASGTTIVVPRRERATAFDFGEIDGRLRLTRLYNLDVPATVNVRFANAPEELRPIEGTIRPFVFAPGEATVADTEVRHFRFASVYGRPAKADVLK